jgi:hypothetical protein
MTKKGDFKNRSGEKYTTNEGYEVEIIEYFGYDDCTLQFKNQQILKHKDYKQIVKGQIKNPYHESVYNIGFIGDGNYKPSLKGVYYKYYIVWSSMLGRCYSKNKQKKHPTYKDVTVCDEWLNFQNFAKWYEENYIEGFHIDKDILFKGNKIYSPETCCFVPREINAIFIKSEKTRGEYPIGVGKRNEKGGFQSTLNNKLIGTYPTIEEAFQAYKIAKENYIKEVADRWKDKITEKTYEALINYQVEITD